MSIPSIRYIFYIICSQACYPSYKLYSCIIHIYVCLFPSIELERLVQTLDDAAKEERESGTSKKGFQPFRLKRTLEAIWVVLEPNGYAQVSLWVYTGGPLGSTGGPMGMHWRPHGTGSPWVALEALCFALESLSVFTVGPFGSSGGPMCMRAMSSSGGLRGMH